jgi:hypothetical protein
VEAVVRTNISTEPFSYFSTHISPDAPGKDMPERVTASPHSTKRVSRNVAQAVEGRAPRQFPTVERGYAGRSGGGSADEISAEFKELSDARPQSCAIGWQKMATSTCISPSPALSRSNEGRSIFLKRVSRATSRPDLLLGLDMRRLDDRPPLFNLGTLQSAQRGWGLLILRWDLQA